MIRVAIVEDIEDIRQGLAAIINASGIATCEHLYADGQTALRELSEHPVDVALIDINLLPGMNGIELVAKLKPIHPAMQLMMCTVYEDADLVFKALQVGATGYVLKNTAPEKLVEAIREIHDGGSPMSSTIARKVISTFRAPAVNEAAHLLSSREMELLGLLEQGHRYKEIAEKLFVSIDTVRSHIRNIYRKLEVQSRAEALNKVYPRRR